MNSNSAGPFNLAETGLILRTDAAIDPVRIDEQFWRQLMAGDLGNFHNEYLVVVNEFSSDWPIWENHPNGDEIVCLLSGRVTLRLELDGKYKDMQLAASGDYARIPRGTWHTALTDTNCRMLFITAGEGTLHRPAGDDN
ncbi:MAG: cupin domain-containing protein [Gammaproteobacteria bacterium]|nr:cupin domain-containing protein [Gammaproteobacteria bacterium]